jgi:hypothetical protein
MKVYIASYSMSGRQDIPDEMEVFADPVTAQIWLEGHGVNPDIGWFDLEEFEVIPKQNGEYSPAKMATLHREMARQAEGMRNMTTSPTVKGFLNTVCDEFDYSADRWEDMI